MTYESNESVTGTALDSIEIRDLPLESLKAWLKTMQLIRVFELSCESLALNSRVVSAVHSSAGQEAVAVGSIAALEPHDLVIGPHRTHHHAMAKGMTARQLMAELFGRSTGCRPGLALAWPCRKSLLAVRWWGGSRVNRVRWRKSPPAPAHPFGGAMCAPYQGNRAAAAPWGPFPGLSNETPARWHEFAA